MTAEALIYDKLAPLVGGRVYPDAAPNGAVRPFITYIKAGGTTVQFMDSTLASKQHGRYQIESCATTRAASIALAAQVQSAMVSSLTFQASPLGEPTWTSEVDLTLYETKQDFSVWSDR